MSTPMIRQRRRPATRSLRSPRPGRLLRHEPLEGRHLLASIVVTTHLDTVAEDAVTSLREAVNIANSNGEDDVISFAASLHGRTIQVTKTSPTLEDDNFGGDIDIDSNDDLVIQGFGVEATAITAFGSASTTDERVFHLHGEGSVTFRDLTIHGGRRDSGAGIAMADMSAASLTLTDVRLADNMSVDFGGALYVSRNSSALIQRSTFDGNLSIGNGGAIANRGSLTIEDTEVFTNESGSIGGGIYTEGAPGHSTTTRLSGVAIYDNQADFGGGGLANLNANSEIINSTISENRTNQLAGAVYNIADGAEQTAVTSIIQTTITRNQNFADSNLHTLSRNNAVSATIEFGNSLFIDNQSLGLPSNISAANETGGSGATLSSLGNNLFDDNGFSALVSSDIADHDPNAVPVIESMLLYNGGPTRTHAIVDAANNPAIDGGNDSLASTLQFDQRGNFFQRSIGNSVDIGSVEHIVFDDADFVVTSLDDDGVDLNDSDVTLREAIFASNVTEGRQTITFSPALADLPSTTIFMDGGEFPITDSVKVIGPRDFEISISASSRSRLFRIDDGDQAELIQVYLGHLTLLNGKADDGMDDTDNEADRGGGIFSREALELENVQMKSNEAASVGGAIYHSGPTRLLHSIIELNSATYDGGGIQADGDLELFQTLIIANSTTGSGGGVKSNARTRVDQSSFVSNHAGAYGGGWWTGAPAEASNSTFSGNTADLAGGGIRIDIDSATLTNVSVIDNRSGASGEGNERGGGIATFNDDLTFLHLRNSIVAGNRHGDDGSDIPSDLAGRDAELGSVHNLIGDPLSSAGLVHDDDGDLSQGDNNIVGSEAEGMRDGLDWTTVVEPLRISSGSTPLHPLKDDSPAIDVAAPVPKALIHPRSAVSNTSEQDLSPASQLIARKGLSLENYQSSRDGNVPGRDGWSTVAGNGPSGDYFEGPSPAPQIVFQLNDIVSITDIVIWGSTEDSNNDVRTFELEFSVDGGDSFSSPIIMMKPRYSVDDYVMTLPIPQPRLANAIRLTVTDNYFGEEGRSGGARVAMNEVRFLGKSTDQRGYPFLRQSGNGVDIGAFERQVAATTLDFGDAPAGYPVLLIEDGARHTTGSLALGTLVNGEIDGTHSNTSDADHHDDGVIAVASMVAVGGVETTSSFEIVATQDGLLDAWIDFNGDRDWSDSGEQIASGVPVSAGTNTLSFNVPGLTIPGDALSIQTAARFRISTRGFLSPNGFANDGEVEDYLMDVLSGSQSPAVTVDLPRNQETRIENATGILTVRTNSETLFAAPYANIDTLEIAGTEGDDHFVIDASGDEWIPNAGFRLDGGSGQNQVHIVEGNLNLTDPNLSITNVQTVQLEGATANSLVIDVSVVPTASPIQRTLNVIGGDGDQILFARPSNWRMGATSTLDGVFFRQVIHTSGVELQVSLPTAWQNVVQSSDVDNSGTVTPLDALVVINELGRRQSSGGSETLEAPSDLNSWPGIYYDTNGDGNITPRDALKVINDLAIQAGSGESVPPFAPVIIRRSEVGPSRSETEDTESSINSKRDVGLASNADFILPIEIIDAFDPASHQRVEPALESCLHDVVLRKLDSSEWSLDLAFDA